MLLLPRKAAEMLCVSENTLAIWRHRGKGPPYRQFGGVRCTVRYDEAELIAWVESNRVAPEDETEKHQRLASAS